jgi:toxin ParE1/3/4
MKIVVFHPLAEQELFDAVPYYEEQRVGLGLEYLEEVEHTVSFLIRYPEAGSKVRGSVRRLALPKFSFPAVSHLRKWPDSYFGSGAP